MYPEIAEIWGRTPSYWGELDKRFADACPEGPKLLEEVVELRGRLSFYESRIREMAKVAGQ